MPKMWILLIILPLMSCSTIRKIGVNMASPALVEASKGIEAESDYSYFESSLASNLKILESMLWLSPENEDLLSSLVKGHSAYAFAVHETAYLEDTLADNDNLENKRKAIVHYSKAIEFGKRYLKERDVDFDLLVKSMGDESKVNSMLEDELSDDELDLEAVMFLGQSVAGLINLQKDNMKIVSYASLSKQLFDWVCAKSSDIHFGACGMFFGAYEASRPRFLGGDPKKGKEIFIKTIKDFKYNWLIQLAYMQFYLIPMGDEDGFEAMSEDFEEYLIAHQKFNSWNPIVPYDESLFSVKRVRLYQTIALERYKIIKKYKDELF